MNLKHQRSLLGLLLLTASVFAQQDTKPAALPKVHFTFDHPELAVCHYELEIDADGKAHYESRIKGQEKGTSDEGMSRDFAVSPETREKIFALIKAANNLDTPLDYTKHKIAFAGNKTITLTDANGAHTARFVWSENQPVTQLTDLLQGISATLEEEPVLQRLKRYDPLGLNLELAKMEKQVESGWLRELDLISSTLKDIAADPNIMGIARKRAERLWQKATASNRNQT